MRGSTKIEEPLVIIVPPRPHERIDPKKRRSRRHHLLTALFSVLLFIALLHFIAVLHGVGTTAVATSCQSLIRSTDYTQVAHLRPQTQQMEAVQFVNQLVGGQPAVLVQVSNDGAQSPLDVYVYGCAMRNHTPNLSLLFIQRGLLQGSVAVSPENTLITGSLDTTLSAETIALLQPQQQNVYREYAWQNGAFVQQLFPGFYPVASRSEAVSLQQQSSSGQVLPWTDPLATAQQMARDLLKWSNNNMNATLLSNDGITAQVQLIQQSPGLQATVTLKRLVQQNSAGLWFVVSAQSPGLTLSLPTAQGAPSFNALTSPAKITGTGALKDGQMTGVLFDHTLTLLPAVDSSAAINVDSSGNYTGTLSYSGITPGQQGLLLIESLPPGGSSEPGQLLLTSVYLR